MGVGRLSISMCVGIDVGNKRPNKALSCPPLPVKWTALKDWKGTPWKFNIAPENIPSQKESSLPTIIFQGRAVKLREGIESS